MPMVRVTMLPGRTPEQKRRLVAAMTDAMVDDAGAVRERVEVVIEEIAAAEWARGGVLLVEEQTASPAQSESPAR
jgi:4-oxalocrotonate tautomerase